MLLRRRCFPEEHHQVRRMKSLSVVAVILSAVCHAVAANYSFTNIVDDADGTFTNFVNVTSVNASGMVAFAAEHVSDNTVGVYKGNGASINTMFQGSKGSYTLPFSPVINASGAVAYLRADIGVANRVVYDNGLGSTVIASSGDGFVGVNQPMLNNSGTVAFGASTPGLDGGFNLYTWSGGTTTARYYSSAVSTFIGLSTVASINNSGVLGFNGTLGPPESQVNGLFFGTGGTHSTITLANGASGFSFLSPFPTINKSGVILFHATSTNGKTGIYSGNGGPLTTYVDTTGPYASIYGNTGFSDGGTIAFYASTDSLFDYGPDGLFTGPNPTTDRVISIGDELFPGLFVTSLNYGGAINEHGQIAFNYTVENLAHTVTRHGIALATPDSSAPLLNSTFAQMITVGGGLTTIGGLQATFDTVNDPGRFSADFFRPTNSADLALRIGEAAVNAVDFSLASASNQVWQLEFSGTFSDASLVFHYDDTGLLVDESQLVIRHYTGGQWVMPNQTIDTVNNTITLVASSFSPFILSNVPEPSSAALLVLGGVVLLRRQSSRSRRRTQQ